MHRKAEHQEEENGTTKLRSVKYCTVKIKGGMSSRRCRKGKINKQERSAGQERPQSSEEDN